jgi:Tfp pilus assembly protein PilF
MRQIRSLLVLVLLMASSSSWSVAADARLDPLFERLKAARSVAEAQPIEAEIWRLWVEGGGAAATSLMYLGIGAMQRGDMPAALGIFDAIVKQDPEFAEGWNKRATVLYVMGALDASAEDVGKVLKLEPRHFGALSGFGLIRAKQQRYEEALTAFESALAVHPQLEGARQNVEALRKRRRDGAI